MRAFTPRWRISPLTQTRINTLLPRHAIPEGALEASAAFGRRAPVVLEIGSGHGAAAIAYAATHPEADVIAAEVHVPGVARMLARADELGLDNLWVERGDALPLLRDRIPHGSLTAVHLFFPDPWPKKKHGKRRFIQQHSLALIRSRLAPGGVLLVATDHEVYAAHIREQVAASGLWSLIEVDRPPWRPVDGFEAKGIAAGHRIHDFRLVPRLGGRGLQM